MSGALQAVFSNSRSTTVYPAIAMTVAGAPGINVFRFYQGQVGVKYANPAGFSDTTFKLAWADLPNSDTTDIAVTGFNTPFIHAWAWNYNTGFGSKYANPATLPASTSRGVDFFGNGSTQVYDIAVTHFGSPYVSVYPWTTGVGFGSKYANPAVLPGSGFVTAEGVSFQYNPPNSFIAVVSETSPYVFVYPWTTGVGFGSKMADPATLPPDPGTSVAFGNIVLAVTTASSPYVSVYQWSALGFGSKYANPVTLPTGSANDVSWHTPANPDPRAIAVAHNTSPYMSVYPFNNVTGFGSKYANPVTLPTGNGLGIDFTAGVAAGSRSLAVGHANSPYVSVYPFDTVSGIGTKSADFTTLPPGNVKNVKFSPNS